MENQISKEIQKATDLKILSFLKVGYDDYLSARILINHKLLLQGTILANTSIEKYLKAILIFKGVKLTGKENHMTTILLEKLIGFDNKLYSQIDKSFIELLEKSYKLRYIDDKVPKGYKISIGRRDLLTNLDYTVSLLANKLYIGSNNQDGKNETQYQLDLREKNQDLYYNNYLLNDIPKEKFLLGIDDVYKFFIDENGNFSEVIYKSDIN
jgi:HEPN domain-containing protein